MLNGTTAAAASSAAGRASGLSGAPPPPPHALPASSAAASNNDNPGRQGLDPLDLCRIRRTSQCDAIIGLAAWNTSMEHQ